MKVYLCDYKYDDDSASDWHRALSASLPEVFQSAATKSWNEPGEEHPAYVDRGAIIICHSNGMEANWRKRAHEKFCHVVLVRSGGKQGKERSPEGNLHGCYWHPDDFRRAPRPARLQSWIDQIKARDIDKIEWSFLQLAPSEGLWALRLLCEGFLNPKTKANLGVSWVKILGPPNETPDATLSGLVDEAANLSPSGDASERLKQFLASIKQNGVPDQDKQVAECLSNLNSLLGVPGNVAQNKATL